MSELILDGAVYFGEGASVTFALLFVVRFGVGWVVQLIAALGRGLSRY